MMRGMVIDMNDKQLYTLAQLQAFLDGTVAVDFAGRLMSAMRQQQATTAQQRTIPPV